jgi:hypothetical protein
MTLLSERLIFLTPALERPVRRDPARRTAVKMHDPTDNRHGGLGRRDDRWGQGREERPVENEIEGENEHNRAAIATHDDARPGSTPALAMSAAGPAKQQRPQPSRARARSRETFS